jgi:hypothetical protein
MRENFGGIRPKMSRLAPGGTLGFRSRCGPSFHPKLTRAGDCEDVIGPLLTHFTKTNAHWHPDGWCQKRSQASACRQIQQKSPALLPGFFLKDCNTA